MHKDKYLFAPLASYTDRNKFNYIVCQYNGDKYVKHITYSDQPLSMMFGSPSNHERLRDWMVTLDAHPIILVKARMFQNLP